MSTNLLHKADHSEGLIFCVRRILYPAAEAKKSPKSMSRSLTWQRT